MNDVIKVIYTEMIKYSKDPYELEDNCIGQIFARRNGYNCGAELPSEEVYREILRLVIRYRCHCYIYESTNKNG